VLLHSSERDISPPPQPSVKILDTPELEVLIEVPRGSFLKRGSTGSIDFVSPMTCPFNYGSVQQ